jgi:hypothetical protein
VHDHGAAQAKQAELHSTDLEEHRPSLIDDVQVVNLVLARPELLKNPHVLASAPHGIHGNVELDLTADEAGEFGERKFVRREAALDGAGTA